MISNAGVLWDALSASAGLDVDGYDRDLLNELAERIGIPAASFRVELERREVTAEAFLLQLLRVVAPYACLVQDVLAFFAHAGARRSATNLSIRFDFDNVADNFAFDLRQFREFAERFRDVLGKIEIDRVDRTRALELRHAFVERGVTYELRNATQVETTPDDPTVKRWLQRSAADPRAFVSLPGPPGVGDAELRALLLRVWTLLRWSAAGASAADNPSMTRDDIRAIVRGGYLMQSHEQTMLERLRSAFEGVPVEEIDAPVLLRELEEIFSLPVWNRRSELYSVWVGVRLITALGDGARVHTVDEELVFSFGGAHLATVTVAPDTNLLVWCELRTRVMTVIGKGRKHAIQPDYVVLAEPATHPDSALLVVECKQYHHQSRENFAAALVDYARGHPKARVALVNYGPVTGSVTERVKELDAVLVSRTHTIGTFRPGSSEALTEFEAMVRSIVPQRAVEPAAAPSAAIPDIRHETANATGSGAIRLSWDGEVDLDLHCWVTLPDNTVHHVSYRQQEWTDGASSVRLDTDVRAGGGVETIVWHGTSPSRLSFAVHAFTEGSSINASRNGRVEMNAGGTASVFEVPDRCEGTWWRLCSLEPGSSLVRIRNIVDDRLLPDGGV